jgi:branched-chain amino acid transport system substrate-binding protein
MNSTSPIRIGYTLSLTGALGSNGRTAQLAHQIWAEDVNRRGGLLGRPVELVCRDDQTNADLVSGIYKDLIDLEGVDIVVGGYGDNTVAPAMPLIMERGRYFVGLMALATNTIYSYDNYFVMIPTGAHPNAELTRGFFDLAARQNPSPKTVAILVADALFSKGPVQGARENAARNGFEVIYEARYPLSTQDFMSYMRELDVIDPDILFLCSYLSDSVKLIQSMDASGLTPRIVGGAMIGPQNGSVKAQLGPLLNGIVNYEYWLPIPKLINSGVEDLISKYQERAGAAGADPLGYYVAPLAYAQLQIVEQAVRSTGGIVDAELGAYTRDAVFQTVVGDLRFGPGGSWATPRVLQVQYNNIAEHDIDQFKRPGAQTVVSPSDIASGQLIYPYSDAKLRPRKGVEPNLEVG